MAFLGQFWVSRILLGLITLPMMITSVMENSLRLQNQSHPPESSEVNRRQLRSQGSFLPSLQVGENPGNEVE